MRNVLLLKTDPWVCFLILQAFPVFVELVWVRVAVLELGLAELALVVVQVETPVVEPVVLLLF